MKVKAKGTAMRVVRYTRDEVGACTSWNLVYPYCSLQCVPDLSGLYLG
jgi:hypothetical protein